MQAPCFEGLSFDPFSLFQNDFVTTEVDIGWRDIVLDLSRFDAAPLIAFTATKETDYGTETDGRIPR